MGGAVAEAHSSVTYAREKDHGLDIEPEDRGSCQKRVAVRIAQNHAPMGRKHKAVEILVIEGVVRRRAVGDLGGVVVANEIARIIEIELLFGAVNMDAGWEGNFKYPPTFAVLFVRRDLLATHAILSEQERHGHVVLECVTDEVEELLFCPG